ncbi:1154_t:CDS:2 [Ambispora leptoticha]|uniref:1154_t:CDS:1 n=1 Tax=Ambispora leptoticha TaxID=144679 RepID=A0A9N8ZGK3_9GLOM|nr:1154_t:CDS:2 [Ambispora leptoticha]
MNFKRYTCFLAFFATFLLTINGLPVPDVGLSTGGLPTNGATNTGGVTDALKPVTGTLGTVPGTLGGATGGSTGGATAPLTNAVSGSTGGLTNALNTVHNKKW